MPTPTPTPSEQCSAPRSHQACRSDPTFGRFEQSLGTDLGDVRVHVGAAAAAAARAVGAHAYAQGSNIHFADGAYQPDDPFGIHLLAHEVAHTQQQAGSPPGRQHRLAIGATSDPLEADADRAADAMVAGRPTHVTSGGDALRRQACDPEVATCPEEPAVVDVGDEAAGDAAPPAPAPAQLEPSVDVSPAIDTRRGAEVDAEPGSCPAEKEAPEERDWSTGGAMVAFDEWQGGPAFDQRARAPAGQIDPRVTWEMRFTTDWQIAQISWNNAIKVSAEADDALGAVEGLLNETHGAAAASAPGGDRLGATRCQATGMRLEDVFDGEGMKTHPLLLMSPTTESADAMIEQRRLLTDADSAVQTAAAEIDAAMSLADAAMRDQDAARARARIAENSRQANSNEASEKKLKDEQARLERQLKMTRLAFQYFHDDQAAAEFDQMLASEEKDRVIGAKIAELRKQSAALRVQSDDAAVQAALAEADAASARVSAAISQIDIKRAAHASARRQKRRAYAAFAEVLYGRAKASNATDEEAGQLKTAITAMPLIAEALPVLRRVEQAFSVPSYSEDSGRGAGRATNWTSMRDHVASAAAYAATAGTRRLVWEQRYAELQTSVDAL